MRQARFLSGSLALLLAGWFGSAGCIQNYYPVPVTGPGGTVQYGSVCEVPPAGGTVVVQGPPRTTVVGGQPPRVVVSEPSSRFSWRKSDPDSLATTRVEGNIEEPTLSR